MKIKKIIEQTTNINLSEKQLTRGQQNKNNDFETAVKNIITEYFTEIKKEDFLDIKTIRPGDYVEMNDCFVAQPRGSQSPPDFFIVENNRCFFIECKSIKSGGTPTWNTRFPEDNTIYLIHTKKTKDTTYFLGKDVLSDEAIKELRNFNDFLREAVKEHEKKMSDLNSNPYGFYNYVRNMYSQKITLGEEDGHIRDFIKNPNRDVLEQNVLDYLTSY